MFKYLSLCLFLLSSFSINAQSGNELDPNNFEVIKVDLNSKIFDKTFPFDKPFTLELTVRKGEELARAFIYKVRIKKVGNKKIRDLASKDDRIEPLEPLQVIRIDTNKFHVQVPSLQPDQLFDIAFIHKFKGEKLSKLLAINKDLYHKNDTAARLKFEDLKKEVNSQPYEKKREFFDIGFAGFGAMFVTEHQRIYDNILQHSFDVPHNLIITKEDFQAISNMLNENKLNFQKYSFLYDYFFESQQRSRFANGFLSLNLLENSIIDSFSFNDRILNLNKSLGLVVQIRNEVKSLRSLNVNSEPVSHLIIALNEMEAGLKNNIEYLKEQNSNIVAVIDEQYEYGEWLASSTSSRDIKIRNGQVLIPDFGLSNLFIFENKGNPRYIPRPHVGVNITFKPIDKTMHFRNIDTPKLRHRCSLYLGLTIGKISQGEYSDFYKEMSLMTGVNLRLGRQTRIGSGLILLRSNDDNPIVTKTHIQPGLYGSISFDLNLLENLGKAILKIIN